jgi:hypothetical protein
VIRTPAGISTGAGDPAEGQDPAHGQCGLFLKVSEDAYAMSGTVIVRALQVAESHGMGAAHFDSPYHFVSGDIWMLKYQEVSSQHPRSITASQSPSAEV